MNLLAQKQHKKPIRAPVKQSHFTLAFSLDESFIHSGHGYGNKVSWVLSQTRVALQYPKYECQKPVPTQFLCGVRLSAGRMLSVELQQSLQNCSLLIAHGGMLGNSGQKIGKKLYADTEQIMSVPVLRQTKILKIQSSKAMSMSLEFHGQGESRQKKEVDKLAANIEQMMSLL